ncbi:CHAD domain-containing protein [Lacicoccus alkaliphilus]|uniref:CHAD domain-containing protein n=1 Tax=Lacicoccus alkaliphilus DSM 16010 TaxID=1123231 RepID=A0A1M7DVI4_9BACL|nr:CHAD domain-containing protein [Salinicoccus alkaliphilus]SHL83447.1 CHAD domain-containing protein [Salinicoccus alkaliphilus DSM 16010]
MTDVKIILAKRAGKVGQSYKDFINNPFQEKTVHKLRVDCRKLRGIMNLLKKTMYKEDYEKLNQELKTIALMLSDLREIDVLIGLCDATAKRHPDMSDHFQEMFFYLNDERLKKMKQSLEDMEKENSESKVEDVISRIEKLEFKQDYRAAADMAAFLHVRMEKKYQKLIAAYDVIELKDYEHVHEVRKDAKKLRFGARYLGKLTELDHKAISKEAKKIQDEFGAVTDHHVNAAMLEDYADAADDEAIGHLFLKISNLEWSK